MPTHRSGSRRESQRRRGLLRFESLEERLTPTTAGLPDFVTDEFLANYQATPTEWMGYEAITIQNEWVLRFNDWDGTSAAQLAQAQALVSNMSSDLSVSRHLGSDGVFLLKTHQAFTHTQLVGLLEPIAGFDYVEPNFLLVPSSIPNDTSFATQWALNNTGQSGGLVDADIDAPEAWNITTGSSGVVVAVIDSGVDYTHPDLIANMWVNPGEIPGDGIDNDGNGYIDDIYGWDFANDDGDPMDDNGHGTAASGIIAAVGNNGVGVSGINWGAQIMALKYADENFVASTSSVIAAVNYATMMRQDYGVNVRVTNNSYGIFGYSQALNDAIAASGDAGIMFVASAGNTSSDNDIGPQYPANYLLDNVLSVAATDRNDNLASFSSFGATTVHLGAPGVSVLTTRLGGTYSGFGGTSAAAPMVAGVAALLWDASPYASVAQVREAILAGTDPIAALQGITVSGGRLNAYGALQQLGLYVHNVTPDVGEVVTTQPLEFVVEFLSDIDPSSVDASSFLVNGIAADSFELSGQRSIIFRFKASPVTSEGLQSMVLLAGSVRDATGIHTVTGFEGAFRYDSAPMNVLATSPEVASQADLPLTTFLISLSEAVDANTLSIRDLILSQGSVVGVELLDSTTIQYTIAGVAREGELQFFLPKFSMTDIYGNPFDGFSGTIDLDITSTDIGPFEALAPLGGLVSVTGPYEGLINHAGDIDELTFSLSAGETVTAIVRPKDSNLVLSAEWLGLSGASVIGTAGGSVILSLTKAESSGNYGIRITGDKRAEYTVEIFRNALVEWEDTSPDSPSSLDATKLELGDGRYAVIGTSGVTAYFKDMTANPGWTFAGQWAYGTPAGLAGDPSAGYTGANVVGYNLNGAYPPSLSGPQYVTTGPIDMTGQTGVQLSFRRWLGIDNSAFDAANIQVSNNGTAWTTVWQHAGAGIFETNWSLQTYDISSVADNQSTVYIRWGLGRTSAVNHYWGWNIDDVMVGGTGAVTADVDSYTLDLTGHAGQRIDIALAGLEGVDYSQQTLRLIGPNGQVIAMGVSGTNGSNYDLGIAAFVVPEDGIYTLQVESTVKGRYTLVVTRSLAIDTEPTDDPTGPATNLNNVLAAIGHIGVPPIEGLYQFQIDASQSTLSLDGFITGPGLGFVIPLLPQTPGSLSTQLSGSMAVLLDGSSLSFVGASIDPLANPGNFLPFGGPADFAAFVSLFGINAYASVSDLLYTASSTPIAIDASGEFDATQIYFEFDDGAIDYSALGESGTFPANTPDSGNQASTPGFIEVLPGEIRLTIPFRMHFVASVPLGFLVDFDFTGTIVATAALPILDDDVYEMTVAAGETITLETMAAFGGTGPANTLDPELKVLAPDGSVLTFDLNSAADGKNAKVTFTSAEGGTYRVIVSATSGMGDYVLGIQRSLPPVLTMEGPGTAVRGQNRTFTLDVANATTSDLVFHIDWNGDDIIDEVVAGTSLNQVQHTFTHNGNYLVQVTAYNSLGTIEGTASHQVLVTSYALQADDNDPSKTNLVVGGTTGNDLINILSSGSVLSLWSFGYDGEHVQMTSESYVANVTGVTGRVIVYGQAGDDLISTQMLVGLSAILEGGDGNDILVAGGGNDILRGDAGHDVLFGGAGDDQIFGDAGNDLIFGGAGADSLWGGSGEDLIASGLSTFDLDSSATFAIRDEWLSDRDYANRVANLSGTGSGLRANGNTYLLPGATVFNDNAVDQVVGEDDQDWLILDPATDLSDIELDEWLTDLADI